MYKPLEKKRKPNYFGQLDMKYLNDSTKFWKIIKPFFFGLNSNKMMIVRRINCYQRKGLSRRLWTTISLIYQKSLNLVDSSESNVDNTGSNCRHSLSNVLSEHHVSVKIIRKKKKDNGEFRFQPDWPSWHTTL